MDSRLRGNDATSLKLCGAWRCALRATPRHGRGIFCGIHRTGLLRYARNDKGVGKAAQQVGMLAPMRI